MKRFLGVSALLLLAAFLAGWCVLVGCVAYEVLHEPQQPPTERSEPIHQPTIPPAKP